MENVTISKRPAFGRRILGLFATPISPRRYLELLHPFWGSTELLARVEEVIRETRDAATIVLRPNRRLTSHRAGQHIAVGVTIDGVRHTRVFSISSAPARADGCITITVKSKGLVSSQLTRAITRGEIVALGEPAGEFGWPEQMPERVLFVTAGSGITPVMAMLRALRENEQATAQPDIVHLHYAKSAEDVIFARELFWLRSPRYRLEIIYSERTGHERFSASTLAAKCPDFAARETWACGPATMLDAIESQYDAAGLASALHTERFGPTFSAVCADAKEEGATSVVRFSRSAKDVRADGKTPLLVVAEQAGISPPHGCRMGICHTCDATLNAGCVRDLRSGKLISEPGTKIRICVSAAVNDVEIDR